MSKRPRERTKPSRTRTREAKQDAMPNVRAPYPIAVAVSDLHLSHKPPSARAVRVVDWYEVQLGYLQQLKKICVPAKKHTPPLMASTGVPLLIAGDLFDDGWRPHKCPPELVNFALKNLPNVDIYAIPGQHDLPNHRLDAIKRSAFWTLVEAGKVKYVAPGAPLEVNQMSLHGFPWGVEVNSNSTKHDLVISVALIHSYIWTSGTGHAKADRKDKAKSWASRLKGYDVAFFGDNHSPFATKVGGCEVINCGTFFKRKRDEVTYKPSAWILYSDGSIDHKTLDTSQDKWADFLIEESETHFDAKAFLDGLRELKDAAIDFGEALRRFMDSEETPKQVRELVIEALGGIK